MYFIFLYYMERGNMERKIIRIILEGKERELKSIEEKINISKEREYILELEKSNLLQEIQKLKTQNI